MSDQVPEELIVLNKKLQELFERYNELKGKNRELREEIGRLKTWLGERDEQIKDLEIKYERIKISGALIGEGESAFEARKKITELVREIDRCVALLNK